MRGRAVRRIERAALPVGRGLGALDAVPPRFVIRGQADVGEYRVVPDHVVGVLVALRAGARRDAKIACLRVDCVQPTVRPGMQPGDVIADRAHLPAGERGRRLQHREVGLAAGRRKRGRDVMGLAARALECDQQHVLGEPAFVPRLPARDPKRMAFLAEQRVAAVTGAKAHDRELLREVHDETLVRVELAGRMQAANELSLARDAFERRRSHARHDAHVEHDVGRVGDLNAATGVR